MQTYFISQKDIDKLLQDISLEYNLFVLKEVNGKLSYQPFNEKDAQPYIFDKIRAQEPLKAFFFKAHEKVATFPQSSDVFKNEKPVAIMGAKACDLASLKSLDFIFLDKDKEQQDLFYAANRQNNLIVSSDCSYFGESCFCPLLEIMPYVEEGFDLNITKIRDGFLLDVGSKKGENIALNKRYLKKPTENQMTERKKSREKLRESFKQAYSSQFPLKGKFHQLIKKNYDSSVWKDYVDTCVECGGCNLVCPTCHCFLLYDKKGQINFERLKVWDACQYAGFARVAGGANPRKKLYERLRYRYLHKFVYFKENYDILACTGCGRCIDICMGKIDMRKVISALEQSNA